MPRRWNETIEEHRREVREAILDAAAGVLLEEGLASLTMTRIAERSGIGRATLYKYFPDVQATLRAWHERQIEHHLALLVAARDEASGSWERLRAVIEAYARVAHESHGHDDPDLVALMHRDEQVAAAQHRLRALFSEVLTVAAQSGDVRDDVPAGELANFCVHALAAAGRLHSDAAVRRLIAVTLAGLKPVS